MPGALPMHILPSCFESIKQGLRVEVITSADTMCRLFVAWVFNMAFSSLLVGVATWTVVEVAPAAAGLHVSQGVSW